MDKTKLLSALLASVMLFTACAAEKTKNDISAEDTSILTENTSESEAEKEVTKITYEIDPEKPVIALTFDDGPNTTTTSEVLDLLEKYNVRASFFLIGTNITEESAEVVKRAYDMGCEINNHSKTHSDMTKMTPQEIKDEVDFVSEKIKKITGETARFFRPPYIAVNDTMYESIDMPFIAGAGCNDWEDSVTADMRVKKIERQLRDGVIILMHDAEGNSQTVEALDRLIPEMLEMGYQFATVSELFEAKGVQISGDDVNLYGEVKK